VATDCGCLTQASSGCVSAWVRRNVRPYGYAGVVTLRSSLTLPPFLCSSFDLTVPASPAAPTDPPSLHSILTAVVIGARVSYPFSLAAASIASAPESGGVSPFYRKRQGFFPVAWEWTLVILVQSMKKKIKRVMTSLLPVASNRRGECNRCGECCKLPYKCPFLRYDEGGLSSCAVYRFRPPSCRKYPRAEAESSIPVSCGYYFVPTTKVRCRG